MTGNYWDRWSRARSRRRSFITGAGVAGVGAASFALVGCGGDDDEGDSTSPTSVPSGGTGTTPSSSSSPAASKPNPGGTARFPMNGISSGNPPTIFPFENLTYLAQTPASFMYSRLVRGVGGPDIDVNDNTKMEGDFTSGWEQPDDLTYIFKLKPNVKWQDKAPLNGRAATAQDFVNTYDAFLKTSQNGAGWKAVVEGVTAPDEKTIQVKLIAPYAPFLITHASSAEACWFIPVETIDNNQAKTDPVGTGPWVFESFESGVGMNFRKNATYFDAPFPYIDKVEAGMLGDPQRLVAALQAEEYDLSGLSGTIFKESRSKLNKDGKDTFTKAISTGAFYFNFDIPPFNDARVRQAISMAMDRDGYLKIQDGTGKGDWYSFIPPGLAPYYVSPRDKNAQYGAQGKFWKRDVKEARALLLAATGSDTLKFKLNASVDRYGADMQSALDLFVSTLKEAGLEAEVVLQDYASYIQSTYLGKFTEGCACGPLIGSPRDPDNMFNQYWSKSLRHNFGGTMKEQPELDAMIEKQRTLLDNDERLKFIQDMQVKMSEFFNVVPYHASAGYVYSQPWLKDFYYKAGYAYAADSLMKSYFTPERVAKG